jgi:small-conductance mechanosensitive channel
MNRLVNRFGRLITASFIVMVIGIIVFVLSLPLYMYADIDTDVIGFIIFTIGVALLIIGIIRRNKLGGWKLAGMIILAGLLLWPAVLLIASLIYYLATGRAIGD